MKDSKKIINILAISLLVITLVVLFILRYEPSDLKIITDSENEVTKYADKHHLEKEILADSAKIEYVIKIEDFAYNNKTTGISISKYDGLSKEIVIPYSINNKIVTEIEDNAFVNARYLKKITLSPYITSINENEYKDIEIICYDTEYCQKLKENKDLQVTILNDSDYTKFYLDPLYFEYNINDNNIEITKYTGSSKNIIIPESINGYEVNKVSLDIKDKYQSIYLPSTVQEINFNFESTSYNPLFWIIIIIDIIATILVILFNTFTKTNSKNDQFNNTPKQIISFLYLLFTLIFSLYSIFSFDDLKLVLIVNSIALVIYLVLMVSLNSAKEQISSYDNKIKHIDDYKKELKNIIEDIENDDEEIKKEIDKIKDLVEYSDPVSSEQTKEIEKEIKDLLQNANDKDLAYYQKITKLINKRNRICKDNK